MGRSVQFSVLVGVVIGAVLGLLVFRGMGPFVGIIMGGCLGYVFHLAARGKKE